MIALLAGVAWLALAAPSPGAPQTSEAAATIVNSGSSNTAGYSLDVSPGGEAHVRAGAPVRTVIVERTLVDEFFAALAAAGPLDALRVRHCMKSASFGYALRITQGSTTSPDLSCGGDMKVVRLERAILAIAGSLRIGAARVPVRE